MISKHEVLDGSGPHYSCGYCFSWVLESKAITRDNSKRHFCSENCLEKWCEKNQKKEQSSL